MNTIDELLNKYFEGQSSLEDEKILKEYFRSNKIFPQHAVYKSLFIAFEEEKQVIAPKFSIPAEEVGMKEFSRKRWVSVAGAAAAILLAIVLFPLKNRTEKHSEYLVYINGERITNPQRAKEYADEMFLEADEIIRESYEPFIKANTIENEMDADKIFNDLSHKINYTN